MGLSRGTSFRTELESISPSHCTDLSPAVTRRLNFSEISNLEIPILSHLQRLYSLLYRHWTAVI